MLRRASLIISMVATLLVVAAPAFAQYPPVTTTATVSATTVAPGASIVVEGEGWQPGSTVTVAIDETIVLGTVTVAGDGTFRTTVTVPSDLAPGAHRINLSGTGADGEARTVVINFTVAAAAAGVTAPGGLAATGGPVSTSGMIALVLLFLGGMALLSARARSRAAIES